jgi:hypothetical protein
MAGAARVVYEYDVPASIGGDEIKTVGVVELTAEEELQATRRARGDSIRLAFELAKTSLHEVNGERLNHSDGTADRQWNAMPPKLRNLVLQAYSELHSPEDDAAVLFKASRKIKA